MGKIHTHYDNLKVSRGAPQEVVRAAYKALSQKYHPDKNPGDEKAARIMAIVNTAYGTLSDPVRRKEHDEWIAQEEFEIEWLESTRNDDAAHRHQADTQVQAWPDQVHAVRRPRALLRNWRWWATAGSCLAAGWVAGVMTVTEPRQVSTVLAAAWGGKPPGGELTASAATRSYPRVEREAGEAHDGWAGGKTMAAEADPARSAPIKVMALSQVILPGASGDCENDMPTLVAPNGEPWPGQSGYVDGYPVGNKGDDMSLTLDNSSNASPVFIKVYDMDRRSNVRYVFVQPHDKLVVNNLVNGKYEIRYQNIDLGSGKGGCSGRRRADAS
jgi:hypothetical protein